MPFSTINQSAAISSVTTRDGQELVLKFDNPKNYLTPNNRFFGASVGRYANRIYGSKIKVNGKEYPLAVTVPAANGVPDVTLHGGISGWDKKKWQGPEKVIRADGHQSLVYTYLSPHLDEGFPGEVEAEVIYTSYTEGEKDILELEFVAKLTESSPVNETVISLTNHSHFNVSPESSHSIEGTRIKVNSNKYLVHDPETRAPTGAQADFPGIPTDLSEFVLGKEEPAIDHCFVVQPETPFTELDTRSHKLNTLVTLYHPESKIHLDIASTEPVYQIYTTIGMNVPKLEGESRGFGERCGIAVEPARYTNAVNNPQWRDWVTLKKGDTYGSKTVYTTWRD